MALKSDKSQTAFHAEEISGASSSTKSTEESNSGSQELDEVVHFSKEASSKIPRHQWIADSGASTHMADQINIFSGPLVKIRTRNIRVGGGVMHSDEMGVAILKDRKGNQIRLPETLYVPGLGANLLSGRKMCDSGLKGSFDTDNLWFEDKSGKRVIQAIESGGVYIVDSITPQICDFAFKAVQTPSQVYAFDAQEEMILDQDPQMPDNMLSTDNLPPQPSGTKDQEEYRLWHRRFAHLGPRKIANLHKVTTLEKPIPVYTDLECETCSLTRMRNRKGKPSSRKDDVLQLVSIDICGPFDKSHAGYNQFIIIVDSFSRKSWLYPLKARSDAPQVLNEWKKEVELQSDARLKSVRSDNAPELRALLGQWKRDFGIHPQSTVTWMSTQNGMSERANQTVENSMRAMLKDSGLPNEFWVEAAETDVYIRNLVSNGPEIDGVKVSPEEAFTGTKPSIDHIKVWGCKVISYLNPKSLPQSGRQDKLMDRGRIGVFLGYIKGTDKQWRLWAPDMRKVIVSSVVKFFENDQGGQIDLKLPIQSLSNQAPQRRPVGRPRQMPYQDKTPIVQDSQEPEPVQEQEAPIQEQEEPIQEQEEPIQEQEEPIQEQEEPVESLKLDKSTRRFLSHVEIQAPRKRQRADNSFDPDEPLSKIQRAFISNEILELFQDQDEIEEAWLARPEDRLEIAIPASYSQAVNDPTWGQMWKEAIDLEITALASNSTWEITTAPRGSNIISSRWVFAVKYNTDGSLEKLKARLVARGFSQKYGVDYDQTFAPTLRHDTLRLFMAICAIQDLECHQVDVNNAFTQSFLKEEIYMEAPPGVNVARGQVLKVLRSLYGLKQAARDWNQRCVYELQKIGFIQSDADPCLLVHPERKIIILVYVDDIPFGAPNLEQINWFKSQLSAIFKIKDLGETKKILGVQITRDRHAKTLKMDQAHYLKDVLAKYNMEKDKAKLTKIPLNGYDALRVSGPQDIRVDQREYQQIVGSLMYLAILTRPVRVQE